MLARHRPRVVAVTTVVTLATVVGIAAALLLATRSASAAGRATWRHVATTDGVRVSAREIPGQAFPEFRGVTVMKADMFQLLAILDDAPRHCEWQASCKVMRVVKHYDEFNRVLYHRLDSPWPVNDRDVVFKGGVTVDWKRKIVWSRFRALKGMVKVESGVVRITRMYGHFKFELIAPGQIRATYQVFSDPGGWLPAWLVAGASKKIPLHTLRGLRAQVTKTRGQYAAFHKRYNPAHGGRVPAQFQPGGASDKGAKPTAHAAPKAAAPPAPKAAVK